MVEALGPLWSWRSNAQWLINQHVSGHCAKERQCPGCERRETPPRRLRSIPQGSRPMKLSSGYQGSSNNFDILLCLHTRIRRGLCNGRLAFNRVRWARVSQTQVAIAIAIYALSTYSLRTLYALSRFLRLTGWVFGRRKKLCLQTKGSQAGRITSSEVEMLVTYRMPIYASVPASGLRFEHLNPLHSALAGHDDNCRSDEREFLSYSVVIRPGKLLRERG